MNQPVPTLRLPDDEFERVQRAVKGMKQPVEKALVRFVKALDAVVTAPGAAWRQVDDHRTPDLVLAGHAGDVRARSADPTALDDRHAAAGARQVPGQQLAARPAAKHDVVA